MRIVQYWRGKRIFVIDILLSKYGTLIFSVAQISIITAEGHELLLPLVFIVVSLLLFDYLLFNVALLQQDLSVVARTMAIKMILILEKKIIIIYITKSIYTTLSNLLPVFLGWSLKIKILKFNSALSFIYINFFHIYSFRTLNLHLKWEQNHNTFFLMSHSVSVFFFENSYYRILPHKIDWRLPYVCLW